MRIVGNEDRQKQIEQLSEGLEEGVVPALAFIAELEVRFSERVFAEKSRDFTGINAEEIRERGFFACYSLRHMISPDIILNKVQAEVVKDAIWEIANPKDERTLGSAISTIIIADYLQKCERKISHPNIKGGFENNVNSD